MKIYTDTESIKKYSGKYFFLDNDFLRYLYSNVEIFDEFLALLPQANLLIDPLTEFEFLRDIFVPEQRYIKENFIHKNLFLSVPNHQMIFTKIQENAMVLSRIYSHQGKAKGASFVDLMLAGRIMLNPASYLLVTGNKKDFPSNVFDIIAVINFENPSDGNMRSFCIVSFSLEKFNHCYENLKKLEDKYTSE